MFSMFLSEDLKENLLIFSNNISYYYVFCVIISLVAVFVACFCQKSLSEVELKRDVSYFFFKYYSARIIYILYINLFKL